MNQQAVRISLRSLLPSPGPVWRGLGLSGPSNLSLSWALSFPPCQACLPLSSPCVPQQSSCRKPPVTQLEKLSLSSGTRTLSSSASHLSCPLSSLLEDWEPPAPFLGPCSQSPGTARPLRHGWPSYWTVGLFFVMKTLQSSPVTRPVTTGPACATGAGSRITA